MRKFIVLLLSIAVLAAITPAQASANHTLRHKVNTLYAFVHNCLAWDVVPVARFGDPNANHGYVYRDGNDEYLAPAIDYTLQAGQIQWVLVQVRFTAPCLRAIGRRAMASVSPTGHLPQLARKAHRLG